MRRPEPVIHTVISLALWPLIIIFSPVILLFGEAVNRYVMRRVRRSAPTARAAAVTGPGSSPVRAAAVLLPLHASLLVTVIGNPLWIALTAPGRWVSDQFRKHPYTP